MVALGHHFTVEPRTTYKRDNIKIRASRKNPYETYCSCERVGPDVPEPSAQIRSPLKVVQERPNQDASTTIDGKERGRVWTSERISRMVKECLSEEGPMNSEHSCESQSIRTLVTYSVNTNDMGVQIERICDMR